MALLMGDITVILTLLTVLVLQGLCLSSTLTSPALSTSPRYAEIEQFQPKLIESMQVC